MEEKKSKILIYIPSFTIGGTISSLSALLASIDRSRVTIDVYSRSHLGPCRAQLTNCRILKENLWLSSVVRSRGFVMKLLSYGVQLIINVCSSLGINIAKYTYCIGGRMIGSEHYDAVIAYQEAVASYVSYMPAKKRIAWIHCDYERVVNENPMAKKNNRFRLFDNIVCVSKSAMVAFERVFPNLAERASYIYNIVDDNKIKELASHSKPVNSDYLTDRKTIVSVGRYDDVKQFDMIPSIAASIKELSAIPFRWYIIGAATGGDNEKKVSARIKEYHVEDEVIIYPAQAEVYPYIAAADILVNTSRSETFSMVIFEARSLDVVPVMNDIPVAHEVINNGIDGIISTIDNMPICISKLLEDTTLYSFESWDNEESINNFYKLIKA